MTRLVRSANEFQGRDVSLSPYRYGACLAVKPLQHNGLGTYRDNETGGVAETPSLTYLHQPFIVTIDTKRIYVRERETVTPPPTRLVVTLSPQTVAAQPIDGETGTVSPPSRCLAHCHDCARGETCPCKYQETTP